MKLITTPPEQKKNLAKNEVVDPSKWARDLLAREKLHHKLMATTNPQRYKQIAQQIQAIIDADGDHD
jgi:hypothetical protein